MNIVLGQQQSTRPFPSGVQHPVSRGTRRFVGDATQNRMHSDTGPEFSSQVLLFNTLYDLADGEILLLGILPMQKGRRDENLIRYLYRYIFV